MDSKWDRRTSSRGQTHTLAWNTKSPRSSRLRVERLAVPVPEAGTPCILCSQAILAALLGASLFSCV